MDLWNQLLIYNGHLLLFSASGFLISLVWYVFSERRRRAHLQKKEELLEESSFFGHFEDIENPSLKIPEFNIQKKTPTPSGGLQGLPRSVMKTTEGDSKDTESLEVSGWPSQKENKEPKFNPSQENQPEDTQEESLQAKDEDVLPFKKPEKEKSIEQRNKEFLKDFDQKLAALLPELPNKKTQETPAEMSSEDSSDDSKPNEHEAAAYDSDEEKVKELLEQIKKDMREQGEQT